MIKRQLAACCLTASLVIEPFAAVARQTVPETYQSPMATILQPTITLKKHRQRHAHSSDHARHAFHSHRHYAHNHRARPAQKIAARHPASDFIPLPPVRAQAPEPKVQEAFFNDLWELALVLPKMAVTALKSARDALLDQADLEADRAYLVKTATPGRTMMMQGVNLSIERLHPVFVRRLAAAIRAARATGELKFAGVGSAYRPPGYRIGGFRDKFQSAHAYGLAVDMAGIGRAGSKAARRWQSVALANGLFLPYGPNNRAEWNHTQQTGFRMVTREAPPLRATITAKGPKTELAMWLAGDRLIDRGPRFAQASRHPRHVHLASR